MEYRIELTGLRSFGYHGVLDFEQAFGQEFVVDCSLLVAADDLDAMSASVSYAVVAELIDRIVKTERFALLETLARELVGRVSQLDQKILEVMIRVHKPSAPIPVAFDDVSVSLNWVRR